MENASIVNGATLQNVMGTNGIANDTAPMKIRMKYEIVITTMKGKSFTDL